MSVLDTCSLQKGIQRTVLLLFTFPPIQPQASFYSYYWPQREEFFTSMLTLFSPNISIHLVGKDEFLGFFFNHPSHSWHLLWSLLVPSLQSPNDLAINFSTVQVILSISLI